jgi:hypothetical protein
MKERTKNILGYGTLMLGALLVTGGIVSGAYSLYLDSITSPVDVAKNKKFTESQIHYMEQLQISNNPRDVVVASLILDFLESANQANKPVSSSLVKQLQNAIAKSPDDVDIAWLEAIGCGRLQAACNSKDAISRLKRLEPENLGVYLFAFSWADTAGNANLRKSELLAMANSRYSDIHYFSTAELYYEALRGWHSPLPLNASDVFGDDLDLTPITDAESRKIMAAGYSMAMGIPPISQLSSHCKSAQLPADELLACQKIASLMVKDKTLLMHSISLRIGTTLFKTEPEATHWREALRTYYWQMSSEHIDLRKKYSERKYFDAWPNIDEISIQKQKLIDQDIPLTPPADWMPENKDLQMLLKHP